VGPAVEGAEVGWVGGGNMGIAVVGAVVGELVTGANVG
jgi:hypothetical protein